MERVWKAARSIASRIRTRDLRHQHMLTSPLGHLKRTYYYFITCNFVRLSWMKSITWETAGISQLEERQKFQLDHFSLWFKNKDIHIIILFYFYLTCSQTGRLIVCINMYWTFTLFSLFVYIYGNGTVIANAYNK